MSNYGLLVTPFHDNQELDLQSLGNLIEFAIDDNVEGLIPLGTTGEFFSLTPAEKCQVIDFCIGQVRRRVPVSIGVGYSGTRIAAELAQYAATRGADGILVPPPYYYPLSDTSMNLHFSSIAEAVGIDIMLYDGGGGIEIPALLIDQLNNRYPHIRQIKVSVLKANKVAALRAALGTRAQLLCGDEAMLMPSLSNGAVGMATASGIVLPKICTTVCRRFLEGNTEGARSLYAQYLAPWTMASGINKSEFVRCFKEVLAAKGVIASPMTRLPLDALTPSRKADLLATAASVEIL